MSNKENIYVRTPIESPAEITTELPAIKKTDEWGNQLSPEEIQSLALEAMKRIEESKTN
ncbi:hypothetical protein KA043_02205 [Candidatus Saccharibacteria bacterium]|nr:hypothetical protein [Candidatus Saccharibacteria bacterium]